MRRWLVALGACVIIGLVILIVVAQQRTPAADSRLPDARPSARVATSPTEERPSFPGRENTGIPTGTTLADYEGPCAITIPGTRIDSKRISCDRLVIQAADVVVVRSSLLRVDLDQQAASLTIEDSDVTAGAVVAPAIGFYNITLRRVDVRGGQTSVLCGSNCLIEDSWLHDQMDPVGEQHLGGYLSSGGKNVVLRGNTIECTPVDNDTGGGCTGDAQIFPDFQSLSHFRFEGNLFKATPGGYCTSFGTHPNHKNGPAIHIEVIDNVFGRGTTGKCGVWGPDTSFFPDGQGNVWEGNTWDDGSPLEPS